MQSNSTSSPSVVNGGWPRAASPHGAAILSSADFSSLADFVVGQGGQKVSEVNGSGSHAWQYTNVYANGELLATYDNTGLHFALNDWLGTKRVQASPAGAVELNCWNLPFNDGFGCSGPGSDSSNLHYTGKEHDPYTALDLFGAREYTNFSGRFLSPDPQTPTPLHLLNPQRWNMYGYGLNNPLSYTDSGGRDAAAVNFSKEIAIVGHEGIMSVHSDGTVTYARFGPAGGSSPTGPGQVQSFTLSAKIQFDSSGQPTSDSLNAVKNELATSGPEKGQDPSSIRLNYFKTTDAETANLDQWIQQQQDASNRGQSPRYNVLTNNCTMFCQRGLVAGSAMTQSQADKSSIVPNFFWYQLSQEPKATVTSSECDSLPDGTTRCQ
jgi:RHS repeat-associated protein